MKHDLPAGVPVRSIDRKRVRLDGVSRRPDPRVDAIRADLADVAAADDCFAPHYAEPVPRACLAESAMLRGTPDASASAITELLHGEAFQLLDTRAGWAWGYCGHDHYVGYLPMVALGEPVTASHLTSCAAPLFVTADIKAPVIALYPAHARLNGTADGDFIATAGGFVHARHVRAIEALESDWVAVAQRHLGAPYVWGGRGGLGYDCSGLVQVALAACGIVAPRDTDQQAAAIGEALDDNAPLRRGDILFFPGHVGMMADDTHLLHANAHWMATVIEPLADVVARLAGSHDTPIIARRRIVR